METFFLCLIALGIILLIILIIPKLNRNNVHSKQDVNNYITNELEEIKLSDNDKLIDAIDRNTKAIKELADRRDSNTFTLCLWLLILSIGICIFIFYMPELQINKYMSMINNILNN